MTQRNEPEYAMQSAFSKYNLSVTAACACCGARYEVETSTVDTTYPNRESMNNRFSVVRWFNVLAEEYEPICRPCFEAGLEADEEYGKDRHTFRVEYVRKKRGLQKPPP